MLFNQFEIYLKSFEIVFSMKPPSKGNAFHLPRTVLSFLSLAEDKLKNMFSLYIVSLSDDV